MKVFIVHGSFGDAYVNWQPWLVQKLKERKIECVVPAFPTPIHQNYNDWKKLLDYYYEMGYMTEETVFIGHSAGSICIARYLSEKNVKAKGLILTAGYNGFYEDSSPMKALNESFYVKDEVLACLKTNIDKRYNIVGDDDPYIPKKYFEKMAKSFDAELVVVHNGGHFNVKSGYNTFPLLLEMILKC